MARSIKKFVNEGFFQTVDLDLLDRLLESYADRLPFRLSDLPKDQGPRRKALYESFLEIDETFPPQLLDALHCIVQLSDLRGLQLLRERADLAEVPLVPVEETDGESDGRHLHPQHVALRAYLDHREIFDKAIVALAFFQASSPMEFNGAREGIESRHDDPEACEAFRDAVSAYFRERYLGRHCRVLWYPEDDEVNILIRHGRNMVVLTVEEHGDEQVASIREVRQDTIRYRPATGRLKVSAEQPIERKQLSRLFAEHLLGESNFFDWSDSQNLYTLQPVRDQGIDFELKTDWDEDLKTVRIAEIQVMQKEEDILGTGRRRRSPWVLTVRDPRNAIKQLKRLLPWINFETIGINYLKLEFKFWLHGKDRYIMVKIKPRDVVSFRQHIYEDRKSWNTCGAMAFVSLDLLDLVLQRIGQHPVDALYGVDVDRFGGEALQLLLERQILVQQPMLDELDGCRVQWIGTRPFLFDLDADRPPEEVDPRLLSVYGIDVLALCRAFRRANQLAGPPVAQLSDLTYFIGHRGDGRQRRSVCLARLLRDNSVLDAVQNLRARIGTGTLVLLTPGAIELRRRTLEHLSADRALLLPFVDSLDREAPHPFTMRAAVLARAKSGSGADARLQVDTTGGRATLDSQELSLGRREFAIFSALSEEASDKNGYVSRNDLLAVVDAYRANPADPARPENLDNALSRLRRALALAAGIPVSEMTPLVETKRGLGHRLGLRKLGLEPSEIAIF